MVFISLILTDLVGILLMILIRFSILLLALFNFSCARPNYQDDTGRTPASDNEFSLRTLNLQFYWDHRPTDKKDAGSFTLEFFDPQDRSRFLDPQEDLVVFIWMPDMGHGSSPVKVDRLSQGVYRISNVYFLMGGRWDIHIQLKQGEQLVEEVIKTEYF